MDFIKARRSKIKAIFNKKMKETLKDNFNDFIQIEDGLKITYEWFEKNYNSKEIRL